VPSAYAEAGKGDVRFELGVSMTYYGRVRRDGLGLALDTGLGALGLRQRHDREDRFALALLAAPAMVWTHGRVTELADLRGKAVVYKRLTRDELTGETMEIPTGPRKLELGPKLGLRVGF
jgi:hypothetical protein